MEEDTTFSKIFQYYYPKLVKTLPMDDAIFMAELYSHSLLPSDLKDYVESLATSAKKASSFLDRVIKPSVTSGVGRNFYKLLDVMEGSEYQNVNELAKLIRTGLQEGECKRKVTDGGQHFASDECTSEPAPKKQKSSQIDVRKLKARYHRLSTSKTDYPKHKVTKYIRLALIEKEDVTLRDDHLDEFTKMTLQGDVDSILKKKEPLNDLRDIFHYQDIPCPRLILIMGGPGIGKTTLANEICLKWAKEGFLAEDFDVVILIPMRSVQQRPLEEVLIEHVGEENYLQLKNETGSGCLIILEGFDEMAVSCRKSDRFLIRLIKQYTVLEEATVVITSRPHACEDLNADRRIEIVGFGKNEIKEFVEKSFPNSESDLSVEFLQQLDEYPHLHSLCYVPMNLVMIVDIFQCNKKKLPCTLTELYQIFIVMTLQRQVKKVSSSTVKAADNVNLLCRILKGIPEEMVEIVWLLSRLAYCGLFDWYDNYKQKFTWRKVKSPRIIFTESDLTQCGIEVTSEFDGFGLLKASHLHQLPTDTTTYNFAHLTIQEFLSAVHISSLSQQEQFHLLEENFQDYPTVFTFVCSLTELGSSAISQYVHSRMMTERNLDVITAVRCINESKWLQESSIPTVSPFTLDLAMKSLLPYDSMCISHVLSCYRVSRLIMKGCKIGDTGVKLLVRHYPYCNTTGQLLEELDLMDNKITIEGLRNVMVIVRPSFTKLRILNIGKNDIGDEGMGMILETLQDNKSLTELNIEKCGLSSKGASYTRQLLNVTDTLQVLNMSGNTIGDDGMAEISEGLRHNAQLMLTELWVSHCGLSVKGAISISEIVMVKHSLQKLLIGFNNIGDDGISAIAGALGNCQLNELSAMECNIALAGTRSLASALSSNHTIKALYLQDNPITVEGNQLINDALPNCYVGTNSEYKKKDKAIVKGSVENKFEQSKLVLEFCPVPHAWSASGTCSWQRYSYKVIGIVTTANINSNSSDKVTGIASSTSIKVPLIHKSADGDDSVGHVTIQEETGGCHSDIEPPENVDHICDPA